MFTSSHRPAVPVNVELAGEVIALSAAAVLDD